MYRFLEGLDEFSKTPIKWDILTPEEQKAFAERIDTALKKHSPGLESEVTKYGIEIFEKQK